MENASKALLMAGGILIALLILGALIMMFTSLQDYQNTNDAQTKNSQIAQFNNQFEPYNKDGKNDKGEKDEKNTLTLMELKSVYNKIESNNNQHSKDSKGKIDKKSGYYIEHNIEDIVSSVLPADDFSKFKTATGFRDIEDAKKQTLKFICVEGSIEYKNLDGRISKMTFGVY